MGKNRKFRQEQQSLGGHSDSAYEQPLVNAQNNKIKIRCRWCGLPGVIGAKDHEECVEIEAMSKNRSST